MLQNQLESALDDLERLLQLTNEDIEDIKEAKHEDIFLRIKPKEQLISSFEEKKRDIDYEITKLSKESSNQPLETLLNETEQNLLEGFKDLLITLKERNRHYARMVLAVSEFYNSLLEKFIPTETHGYTNQKRASSFLQIKA